MFWIRADGNEMIGAGHLMRCMTVAQEFAELWGRENINFMCADSRSGEMAEEAGFRAYVLNTDYRNMESELPIWARILMDPSGEPDPAGNMILVDSYYVTDRYLSALRGFGRTVLLDDLGHRVRPVDCVVNYNVFADVEQYHRLYRGTDVRLLIGSEYVPVRRQFRDREYRVKETPMAALITTGGGDVDNIGGRILERLCRDKMEFYLVTGRFNPHLQELQKLAESSDNIHIRHDVKDMAGLMEKCDIAVTAGGSTVYELAAVGVPFVCFSYAENQEPLVEYIGTSNIAGAAGMWHKDPEGTLERIADIFEKLLKDPEMRQSFHRREKRMVDAGGATRLADRLGREFLSSQ